jgi:hypothetical protein
MLHKEFHIINLNTYVKIFYIDLEILLNGIFGYSVGPGYLLNAWRHSKLQIFNSNARSFMPVKPGKSPK